MEDEESRPGDLIQPKEQIAAGVGELRPCRIQDPRLVASSSLFTSSVIRMMPAFTPSGSISIALFSNNCCLKLGS